MANVYGTLDVAARLGVSTRTVRKWDQQFEPFLPATRDAHGVRAYPEETVRRFGQICALREKGLSLPAIHEVLQVFYDRRQVAGPALTVSTARPPGSPMVDQFLDRLEQRMEQSTGRQMHMLRDHLDLRLKSLADQQKQMLEGIAAIRTPRRERHRHRPLWKRLFGA